MFKLLLHAFFLCALLFISPVMADEELTDPAKPIYLDAKNPTVVVKLKSNPSTGYSWYLQSIDSPWLLPISHQYVAPISQLVGAPGYEQWAFKVDPTYAKVSFYTEIELIYTRPWQVNSSPTVLRIFYKPN